MTISGNKIFFEFDPFEAAAREKPKNGVRQVKQEIADFVLEKILDYVGSGKSPVSGGQWKRSLSKDYKKEKSKYSSALFANMELEGDMLDNLEVVVNRAGNIEVRQTGKQADKADGHNNHSGRSNLPAREYIPKDDQTFKQPIINGIKAIIDGNS